MLDLLTAIQTKWNATTALTSLLPTLYYGLAPDNAEPPTARIVPVSGVVRYQTKDGTTLPAYEEATFQFDVFTDATVANADVWTLNALATIEAAFNIKPLTLSTDLFLSAIRQGLPTLLREDSETWHGYVVFKFRLVHSV